MPVGGGGKPAGGYRAGKKGSYGCKGYPTVSADGTVHGCHPTKAKAQSQARAIWASTSRKSISEVSKAMVSEGDFVMFICHDEEIKVGRVEYVMTNPGMLGMEGSEYALEYMEDDKPLIIRLYEEEDGSWEEEEYVVYHRMSEVVKIESISVSQDVVVEMGAGEMSKAASVGSMVSWNSSGGKAEGKVKRIIRNGSYNVPNSDFTINGTPESPAAVIELYRDGKPTGRMVGHKVDTLSVKKNIWSSFDPREGFSKSNNVSLFAGKRDYSSSTRETMASRGQAMPDGSYPIANRTDLENAIQAVGRAKNYDSVKQHIIRRARALGAMEMLPKDWK